MSTGAHSFTFKKEARLTSKKDIQELFKNGSFFHLKPLQFKVLKKESLGSHKLLVSVPKKYHKKAVNRNKIKRRIKEAYRLNKQLIEEVPNHLIAIIYLSPEVLAYSDIEQKLIKGLKRLSQDQSKAEKG